MKTKFRSKLLTALMILVMLLTLLPTAALTVAAEETEEITEVRSFEELLNAVNGDKTYIKLISDIEDIVPDDELPTKHRLVFNGGKKYLLDLNGYELTVFNHINEFYTGGFSMIEVSNFSELEILNGSLVFDNYFAKSDRKARGTVAVYDDSVLAAKGVNMSNKYTGTVVYAGANAEVTIDGGEYTVQNGFAIYLENKASLTVEGGAYVHTVMGDSASTQYVDGYGALYSESSGELTLNNVFFKSGVQVSPSQIGAFSTATHEVTVNGEVLNEDIFFGTNFEAEKQNKDYYWYTWTGCALNKTENSLFANTVKVISYEKKYPITVESGVAKVDGVPVTEAGYGEEVTVVANDPEEGMEFVRWSSGEVYLTDRYSASTTFTMAAMPVSLEAYYGKEAVKSVGISVGEIIPGQKAYDLEVTDDGRAVIEDLEWREEAMLLSDYDIFKSGKAYSITVLVYPPEGQIIDENMTATVNGKTATVIASPQYALIEYTFEATSYAGFPVIYDTAGSQLGIGGKILLDTALMAEQSAEFAAALNADQVTYQWYRNGEAVDGACASVYDLTVEDADCRFYAAVTVNGKTNYGHNVNCGSGLYRVYLNVGEIVAGGRAPQITSATPGLTVYTDGISITEVLGDNVYGNVYSAQNFVLIPGKTYRLVGQLLTMDGASLGEGAGVYVNGELIKETVDGIQRFFYDFTVPEADYPVYYKTDGAVGIGVTLTVDVERMCQESGTFKNAFDKANPTYQTVFYQWYKNGEAIEGATDPSYTVTTADRDSSINCKVTLVDGKYGIGEQYAFTNVITVITLKMPLPKDGDTRISSGLSADGVEKINIMWWPKETGVEMQGKDTYVEGTVYEYYILFSPATGFSFANENDRTVYVNGEKAAHVSGYAYTGEMTAIHKHQYSDEVWAYDEYGHWKPCIIKGCPDPNEEWIEYVPHWGSEATCIAPGKCGQCGASYFAEHDFSGGYVYQDDMFCAIQCAFEGCGEAVDPSYHTGGVSDCQNVAICDACHHEYGGLGDHVYSAEWKTDKDGHWKECKCGAEANKAVHTDGDGDGSCDECEYRIGTAPDNPENPANPENPTDPEEPAENKGGLGAGAIVGIVIGSLLLVSVGGYAILWFVIRKKTFAELIDVFKTKSFGTLLDVFKK